MSGILGVRRGLQNLLLFAILLTVSGISERSSELTMCGRPGYTNYCEPANQPRKDSYTVYDKITYKCKSRNCFSMDSMDRQCLENGTWSGKIPVCYKAINRQLITKPIFSNRDDTPAISTVDGDLQTCQMTYTNRASPAIWETSLEQYFNISVLKIIFLRKADINIDVTIEKGSRTIDRKLEECLQIGSAFTEADTRSWIFNCPRGFSGNKLVIKFSEPPGRPYVSKDLKLCEVILYTINGCALPDYPQNGRGQKISATLSSIKFSCFPGFELVGESESKCQNDGTWTPSTPPVCKKILNCPKLPSVANGILRYNSTTINSTALLECDEGYMSISEDRVYCLPTGQWTHSSLPCKLIECDAKPDIPNGKGILLDDSVVYGSKLEITCDKGFTATDMEPRQCYTNATWGNLNICAETKCDPLDAEVDGGKWMILKHIISSLVLICQEGYYADGLPVMSCLSNGSWSETNAICRRFPITESWRREWTQNTILMFAVAIGAGTAICVLSLVFCFLIGKKRWQSKANTTVFHVGVPDFSLFSDEAKEQKYSKTYEDLIELRNNPSSRTIPRKPSSALPHLPIDVDPVYAQPFENSQVYARSATLNTAKDYTAHIYAEPVDSRLSTSRPNDCNSVAETWLKSGATKFGRKMSLPRSTVSQTNSNNVAICKPVFHLSTSNSVSSVDKKCETSNLDTKNQKPFTELIENSIYLETSQISCSENEFHLTMVDNDIYQKDSNV